MIRNHKITRAQLEEDLSLSRFQSAVIWAIMDDRGHLLSDSLFPQSCAWERSCFHRPCETSYAMNQISEIGGFYGVEAIENPDSFTSSLATYCNAGDTYTATIAYIEGEGFRLCCWGDLQSELVDDRKEVL